MVIKDTAGNHDWGVRNQVPQEIAEDGAVQMKRFLAHVGRVVAFSSCDWEVKMLS